MRTGVTRRIATCLGRIDRTTFTRPGNPRRPADISEVVADHSDTRDGPVPIGDGPGLDSNVGVADADAPTAAIRERARAALQVACQGWREWRRCTAPDGTRVAHPHPECLAAQYRYELILLENGIPR
jgi:hypothetical protein